MKRRFMSQEFYLQPMYFEAVEDGLTISMNDVILEYKIGINGEWKTLPSGESTPAVELGTKIFFKRVGGPIDKTFITNKKFKLGGDCRSLLHGGKVLKDSVLYAYCFRALFRDSFVTEVEDDFLPSTRLPYNCYSNMFEGCTSLVNAPELPATTLNGYCYDFMFYNCTSLVNAPELPATTLNAGCYRHMFYGCTNLNYIKMLATDISATDCLYNWVSGVASTGTFVKSKDATWDVVGDSGVPTGWTIEYE